MSGRGPHAEDILFRAADHSICGMEGLQDLLVQLLFIGLY